MGGVHYFSIYPVACSILPCPVLFFLVLPACPFLSCPFLPCPFLLYCLLLPSSSSSLPIIPTIIYLVANGKEWPIQKGQEAYLSSIRSALEVSLCLRDFPSTLVEKDNKPYVELTGYSPKIEPLILKPIYLARNKKEQFLIEPSINSCRVPRQ